MSDTIYVSIGNSDDKLPQAEWADFYLKVGAAIRATETTIHGEWLSHSAAPWQNACWAFTPPDARMKERLMDRLGEIASRYHQDSIAWAEAVTTFLPQGGDE